MMLKFAAMTNEVTKIPPSSEDGKITQTTLAGCSDTTCYQHNMHTLLYVTLKHNIPSIDICNQQMSTVMCLPEDALITN